LDRWFLDVPDALLRRLTGRGHWPPYSLRAFVGPAKDFEAAGRFFVQDLEQLGLLAPATRILDLGCGCGRVALQLIGRDVSYAGVDVDRACIDWCRRNITTRCRRLQFQHVDARNASYNPRGGNAGLPYPDRSFDLMLAMSVFTHLLPEDLERTLAEAGRVLAPGGVLYGSAFLFSGEEQHTISFPVQRGFYALHREDFPENAVAYEQSYFLTAMERAGLTLRQPIRRGVQDLMVFEKR
jgi:SAM-dependent methyltransferase